MNKKIILLAMGLLLPQTVRSGSKLVPGFMCGTIATAYYFTQNPQATKQAKQLFKEIHRRVSYLLESKEPKKNTSNNDKEE